MSRSRKKVSCHSDYSRGNSGTKKSKRDAAKAVRTYKGLITNGKEFRKLFSSYDIHDYKNTNWDINDSWYESGKRK